MYSAIQLARNRWTLANRSLSNILLRDLFLYS
jgi:hypothetical protein